MGSRVDPYSLSLRDGALNVVAYCHRHREVLMFSVDGIRDVQPTSQRFIIPPSFSLTKYLEGVIGGMRGELTPIDVRFDASIARWARRLRWEFPHTLMTLQDGSLLLRSQVGNLDKFCKELLPWGAQVEAIEPPDLRERILREAEAIARRYSPIADAHETASKNLSENLSKPAAVVSDMTASPCCNKGGRRRG